MVDKTSIEVITNPEIIAIIAEKQTRIEDLDVMGLKETGNNIHTNLCARWRNSPFGARS